jgi:hypothetical protein
MDKISPTMAKGSAMRLRIAMKRPVKTRDKKMKL